MTHLLHLEQLVATSALPHLNGYGRGSVRSYILDAFDAGHITSVEVLELTRQCNRRLQEEGVHFGPARPQPPAAAPEPTRPPLPPPVLLDEVILDRCSRQRWTPDEPVRQGETAHEQISRLENYRLAIEMAQERGRDLEDRRARDAIWAAVAAETAVWVRAAARRATEAA